MVFGPLLSHLDCLGKKALGFGIFALNPLVMVSTLVDGHNDVVMMALALGGFFLLKKKDMFLVYFFL